MKMNKRDFQIYLQGSSQHLYEDFGRGFGGCICGKLLNHRAWKQICSNWGYGDEMIRSGEFSKTDMIKTLRAVMRDAKMLLADLKEWDKRIIRIKKMCEIFNIDFAEGEVFFIPSQCEDTENIIAGVCDDANSMKNAMEEAIVFYGKNIKKLQQKTK